MCEIKRDRSERIAEAWNRVARCLDSLSANRVGREQCVASVGGCKPGFRLRTKDE